MSGSGPISQQSRGTTNTGTGNTGTGNQPNTGIQSTARKLWDILNTSHAQRQIQNQLRIQQSILALKKIDYSTRYDQFDVTEAGLKREFRKILGLYFEKKRARLFKDQLEKLINEADFEKLLKIAKENPRVTRLVIFAFKEQKYLSSVSLEVIRSFHAEAVRLINTKSSQIVREKGDILIDLHITVANASVLIPMFWMGAIYKIITDLLEIVVMVFKHHKFQLVGELYADFLEVGVNLISVFFDEADNGMRTGKRIGEALAQQAISSVIHGFFPDPLSPDGKLYYGPIGTLLLKAVREQNPNSIILDGASLMLMPFTLGGLIGPFLIDLILMVIGLIFPELSIVIFLKNSRWIKRVCEIFDDTIGILPKVSQKTRRVSRSVNVDSPQSRRSNSRIRTRDTGQNQETSKIQGQSLEGTESGSSSQHRRRQESSKETETASSSRSSGLKEIEEGINEFGLFDEPEPISDPRLKRVDPELVDQSNRRIIESYLDIELDEIPPHKLQKYREDYPDWVRKRRRQGRRTFSRDDYARFRHERENPDQYGSVTNLEPRLAQDAGRVMESGISQITGIPKNTQSFPIPPRYRGTHPKSPKNVIPDYIPPGNNEVYLNGNGIKVVHKRNGKHTFSARFVGDSKYLDKKVPYTGQTRGFVNLAQYSDEKKLVFFIRWKDNMPPISNLRRGMAGYQLPRSINSHYVSPSLIDLARSKGVTIELYSHPFWAG